MTKLRQLLPMLLTILVFFCLTVQKASAESTWSPSFSKNVHVQVDPKLPNKLDGLEKDLSELSTPHGLEVYVVYALQGTESNNSGMKFAPWKLDELVAKWSASSNFPHDIYVVVMIIQSNADPTKMSVAANGGNQLQVWGLTADRFSDPNGPVMKDFKTYMPVDPKGFAKAVVRNVNADISNYKQQEALRKQKEEEARRAQEEHDRAMKALRWQVPLGAAVLGLIGLFVFLFIRFRSWQAKAVKTVGEWQTKIQNSSAWYLKLQDDYFGFLKRQDSWEKKFKGETATKFKAALKDFADFTSRQLAASRRGDEAQKLLERAKFPAISGFQKAIALLTTEDVELTGEALPTEMASLFGGLIEKKSVKPEDLLKEMDELFNRTNKALSGIVDSFRGAEQNKKDIESLLAKVDELKPTLTTNGLEFGPYQSRYANLTAGRDAFLSILDSDPLAAFAGSEQVEQSAEALEKDLRRAISIKQALPSVEEAIGKVVARITSLRGTSISYQYALADGETKPVTAQAEHYSLREDKGNPDQIIEEARQSLADALNLVIAGKLDESEAQKQAASEAASRAVALVDTVLAAKSFVEKQVPAVRANLNLLKDAIPDATTEVATLRADFLTSNFTGEPAKLDQANTLIASTDAELAKIKAAYDEQRYLASRKQLENIGHNIQAARDGLVEIHSRLVALQERRQHAKQTTKDCEDKYEALSSKLKTNSFTTAAETDNEHERLRSYVRNQRRDVDKPVTDWPAAAKAADKLLASLDLIDKAIDQQKADHERATLNVSALNSAIADASQYVSDSDTRQPARSKLGEARQELSDLQKQMQRPKNNWADIARQAEAGKAIAYKAAELARADKQAANEARTAISRANSQIDSSRGSQGHNQYPNLSSAESELRRARSSLSNGNYEEAERQAKEAISEAAAAVAAALAAARAIQAEIDRRAREERERREAQERREREAREARERASRSNSTSGGGGGRSGGGGGGGGRSGGGGGGGGRSGGGGDF